MKNIFNISIFILTLISLSSCEEDANQPLKDIIKDDLGYVPRIARFTMTAPAATTVAAGSNLTFDLRYWSEGTIDDIEFFMIVGTTETKIAELDYSPAYSKITKCDSLIYNYQLPASVTSGTSFSIQARVANVGLENNPTKSAPLALKVQ